MRKAALTGGIATGKSYVLSRFEAMGVPCLDADAMAHGVMVAGTEASAAIAHRFGAHMLTPDGAVDRRRLGPVVFADPAARRDLEAIVHPAVYRAITVALRAFELTERPLLAVVDVPLLYETGRQQDFDVVVATVCSRSMQMTRLRARGLSETDAELRLAAQMPAAEKAARAHHVVRTDGTFDETNEQVTALVRLLLQ